MLLLRAYLLIGLVAHKAVWEMLKRKGSKSLQSETFTLQLIKLAKIAVLLGVIVQTLVPRYVLPISDNPFSLQAAGVVLFNAGLANNNIVVGALAWGTTLHAAPAPASTFSVTETPFLRATLSAGELASITARCTAIIGNGCTLGVCRSCRPGGLGAERQ